MTKTTPEMIAELRRLDAEATPGPWKTDGTFIENKTHIVATSYHPENCERDAALIVAMRNALPELLKALETPVAWLHEITEPDGLHSVMLSKSPENPWSHWLSSHSKQCVYVRKPLFALPPHGGGDEG